MHRRRDTFDYYDTREDDVYDNDCVHCCARHNLSNNHNYHSNHNGTVEFTAVRGHNVDVNSRPLGDQTMVFDRFDLNQQYNGQYNNGYVRNQNPYNTQQFSFPLNSHQNQNPYNTQHLIFNPNTLNSHNNTSEIRIKEEYEKQLENSKMMFSSAINKQNEINMSTFEKQKENEQKTAFLEKQLADLTATLSKVTSNFGESISNLTKNLKNTQEILKQNNNTATLAFNNNDPSSASYQQQNANNSYSRSANYVNDKTFADSSQFIKSEINPVKIAKSKKEEKKLRKEEKKLRKEEKKLRRH